MRSRWVMRCLLQVNRNPINHTLVSFSKNCIERLIHADYIVHYNNLICYHQLKLFKWVLHFCCFLHELYRKSSLSCNCLQCCFIITDDYWQRDPHYTFPCQKLFQNPFENCFCQTQISFDHIFVNVKHSAFFLIAFSVLFECVMSLFRSRF